MDEKVLIVDVDGCVLDLHTPWIAWYNEISGDNLSIEDITSWTIFPYMHRVSRAKVMGFVQDPYVYDHLVQPYPGAVEVINDLRRLGVNVLFASHTYRTVYAAKYDCLLRNGFLSKPDQFLAVPGQWKHLLQCDAIVEDNLETALSCRNSLIIKRPWNTEAPIWMPFMVNWYDTEFAVSMLASVLGML